MTMMFFYILVYFFFLFQSVRARQKMFVVQTVVQKIYSVLDDISSVE